MLKKLLLFLPVLFLTACGSTTAPNETAATDNTISNIAKTSNTSSTEETTASSSSEAATSEASLKDSTVTTLTDKELEDIYLEAVEKLYTERIRFDGLEIEPFLEDDSVNHFAICDIDNDGTIELIISWLDNCVAGYWGGVYEYKPETGEFFDEGLTEPDITFYDTGLVYEGWRHNQGHGEMWPFDAYMYNKDTDTYEHVLAADSWNKSLWEKDFPDDIDADGAGVVYFTDKDSEFIDYDNPISQSEFNKIYGEYFDNAKEVTVTYYELSSAGIEEYKNSK